MKILVTQPAMPPLDEFIPYLKQIWESKWLTNQGPFHDQFENELRDYLGVKYVSLFANGTLALIIALKALDIKGEVITTPFSFVATTHSLWWNNIKPIFADIEIKTLNLDPDKIEQAVSPKTTAILPVHVYGNPCNYKAIQRIAETHNLKVIYDAAHAFGVRTKGEPILNFGDLSVLSFHATKVFNTFEGGAIVCHDEKMKHHIDNLKNFGFRDETLVEEPGINAKMNEFQAALGLLQLKHVEEYIAKRKIIVETYRDNLDNIPGITFLTQTNDIKYNYSYSPILVDELNYGMNRDELYLSLQKDNVFCRRYFYPLISQFSMYNNLKSASPRNLPIATKVSRQIICLPVFPDLDLNTVEHISMLIRRLRK